MSNSAFTPSTNYANAATPSNEGLVNTGAQTFGGDKTFTGLVNANSGINLGQGAVTALDSGQYTPLIGDFTLANLTGGTVGQHNWIRVGNIVYVTGLVYGLAVTTTNIDTTLTLNSLPVATQNFTNSYQATGVGKFGRGPRPINEAAHVYAKTSAQSIVVYIENTTLSSGDTGCYIYYSFSYQVQ